MPLRPPARPRWSRALIPLAAAAVLTVGIVGPAAADPGSAGSSGSSGSAGSLGSLDVFGSLGSLGSSGGPGDTPGPVDGEFPPIDADAPSDWAPTEPIETKIVPKPETVIAEPGQVTSVVGDYGENQTVLYAPGDRLPEVGGFFVVNAGIGVPYGTVGKVVSVETLGSGLVRVGIVPATLAEAYDQFDYNTTVTGEDASEYTPGEGGMGTQARGFGQLLRIPSLFECKRGSEASFTVEGYMSDIRADAKLSADVDLNWFNTSLKPYFKVDISAKLNLDMTLAASTDLDCSLKKSAAATIVLPVAGPVTLKINPAAALTGNISGTASASLSKVVRGGFEIKGNDIRRLTTRSEQVQFTPEAEISASLEATAGISGNLGLNTPKWVPDLAAGQAGAELTIGAFVGFDTSTNDPGCVNGTAGLKSSLNLNASFSVLPEWKHSLGSKRLAVSPSGPFCAGTDPGDGGTDPGDGGTDPGLPPETRPGQLTGLVISPNLQCRVDSTTDGRSVYYGDDKCSTAVSVDGQTHGFTWGSSPELTPVSQTSVGSGANTDPRVITTMVAAGDTGVTLKQIDSFVEGSSEYLTAVTVQNTGTTSRQINLYRAADCYLNRNDFGVGRIHNQSVSCVSSNGRSITWTDLTGGATLQEANYGTIWSAIAAGLLFDGTVLDQNHDNGAGLSWTTTLEPGQSITYRSRFQLVEPADLPTDFVPQARLAPGPDVKADRP